MSLATNVTDLAQAVGNELKSHKVLINGNAVDLSGLHTTAQASLVAAINEVSDSVASASGIDDGAPSTTTAWSSQKVSTELAGKAATSHSHSTAQVTGLDVVLADKAAVDHTHTVADVTDFEPTLDSALATLKDDILGGAGAAYDTLGELATLVGDNTGLIESLETVAANRVSFLAQTLTDPQKTQARDNIGAASAASLSALATDTGTLANGSAVSTFAAALL